MPIDTSIYQNLSHIKMPSMLDSQAKAANLSTLTMQQDRMMKEGVREDQLAQHQQKLRNASVFGQALDGYVGLPPDQKAKAYPMMRAQLIKEGAITPDTLPEQEDPGLTGQLYNRWRQSSESIERQLKVLQMSKLEAEAKSVGPNAELERRYKESQIAKNYSDAKKEKNPALQLPSERLAKSGGDVKQKIGFLTGGLQALTNYEDTFRKGGRQSYIHQGTPLVGGFVSSTPVDEARTSVEESIGRLASGGAINKDEESRFRRMMPTASDSDESAARKLVNLRKEMEGKLTAYGFKPEELGGLGYDPSALGYGTEHAGMENRGLVPSAQSDEQKPVAAPTIKPGETRKGFVFMGGDPSNQKSWKRAR